jgi:hypothetical protein
LAASSETPSVPAKRVETKTDVLGLLHALTASPLSELAAAQGTAISVGRATTDRH